MEKGTGSETGSEASRINKGSDSAKSVVVNKNKGSQKKKKELVIPKDQKRFFVDYSRDAKNHKLVVSFLEQANQKEHGREVVFKDLVDAALSLVSAKDIERLKESSLGEMDKVQLLLEKHNSKHGTNLSLGEFLVERLKIS
tara:strand:+ start:630 stop:1052 length:423 start_codon:yes stop_codon:yes gene_type:complete